MNSLGFVAERLLIFPSCFDNEHSWYISLVVFVVEVPSGIAYDIVQEDSEVQHGPHGQDEVCSVVN